MGLPPGPPASRTAQTVRWALRPWAMLDDCRRRYGDVFTLRLAALGDTVIVAEPELARAALAGDPAVFQAGRASAILEPLVGTHSLLLLDGEEHLRHRRLMLPPFHGRRLERYAEVIADVTERELARWPEEGAFALRPRMQAITLEVIVRAVFGVETEREGERLRHALVRVLDEATRHALMVMLPRLRRDFGPWRPWSRFAAALADLDTLILALLEERRSDGAGGLDVLSLLLEARDDTGRPMSDRELRDELVTLLVAGHETTATALTWAFERLVRHPSALARLTAALDDGTGEAELDAVVAETLRLRPVITIVGRFLTREADLGDWRLPAGSVVAPCPYLVHRRADLYPDPHRFRPERFLERTPPAVGWMPWGGGVRRCLGAPFATLEMKVVLATVLRGVRLRALTSEPERPRRRAITLVPEHDGRVRVEARRRAALAPT